MSAYDGNTSSVRHHPGEGIIHHLTDNEFKEYVSCKGQGSTGFWFFLGIAMGNRWSPDKNGFLEPVLPSSMP